jgi:transmembrane sensor
LSTRFSPPPYHAQLTETAADWLSRLDAGTADVAAFEAWRDSNARHAAAFAEVAATWRDLDGLRLMQTDAPMTDPAPATMPRRQMLRAAMGAAVAAGLGGGFAYRAYARDHAVTNVGEHLAVSPAQGLSIDLNTDSRISWRMSAPQQLWLEQGEIAIASQGGCELTVNGESFRLAAGHYNARLRGDGCELAVFSGRISNATGLYLAAGEMALMAGGRVTLRTSDKAEMSRVTAWRNDTLVLNGESLDYALGEINRYLKDKIVIGDPALARIRLGGTFGTRNPAEFLQALQDSFGVRATTGANGGIILTRG